MATATENNTPAKRARSTGDGDGHATAAAASPVKKAEVQQSQTVQSSLNESKYEINPKLFMNLVHTKVQFFVNPSNVVFVSFKDDKVVDVWKGLVKHNFLSTPVLLRSENKYYGSVDMADIVSHLVKKFGREDMRNTEAFWKRVDAVNAFGDVTIGDITQYPVSRRNPFHPVDEGYSVMFALELLAREPNLHRVPVVSGKDRRLVNMITQSQIVAYLHKHLGLLGDRGKKTIAECPDLFKNVLTVKEHELAIDAFDRMIQHEVSGLAVVNEEGRLEGNLSLRDLKLVGHDLSLFWRFYQTVANFLLKLRKEYQDKDNRPKTVQCVTKDETLAEVVVHLANFNVHRLYIVDSKKTKVPIGVVSLKDILAELLTA